jgi:hypothetical protein
MGSVADMQSSFREELQLNTSESWSPEVVISGSLGFLLSVYLGAPTFSFHVCTSTSEQLVWDASLAVDPGCSAHDFLESIRNSYQQNTTLPAASLQSFWLRMGNFKDLASTKSDPLQDQ